METLLEHPVRDDVRAIDGPDQEDRELRDAVGPQIPSRSNLEASGEAADQAGAPGAQRGLRVLVVEDDGSEAELVHDILIASWAGVVDVTRDGESALAFLVRAAERDAVPDLVLLDLNLPRLTGREVLRQMKASPGLRDIPVAVLTTSDSVEDRRLCLEIGAVRFITKPRRLAELEFVLEDLRSIVEPR